MKKYIFSAAGAFLLLLSCSQETTEKIEEANLTVQKNNWKTGVILQEIADNQQQISHYEFDVNALNELIADTRVTFVWFDLGLNDENQITFSATGVDGEDIIIGELPSFIISTQKYQADFSALKVMQDVRTEGVPPMDHILTSDDAYQYLTGTGRSLIDLENALTQEGFRVERFGYDVAIVKRMLLTHDIDRLALFFGTNKNQKLTTVFIAIDKYDELIIDANMDAPTSGRAFDFSLPRPPCCSPE